MLNFAVAVTRLLRDGDCRIVAIVATLPVVIRESPVLMFGGVVDRRRLRSSGWRTRPNEAAGETPCFTVLVVVEPGKLCFQLKLTVQICAARPAMFLAKSYGMCSRRFRRLVRNEVG